MARAKRHYIPGQVWHITHRCHKRDFLLKFVRDRQRWMQWLFEAKRRYGLTILNYIVTSNHIHLLVLDDNDRRIIPRSMQLIAGRCAQEYNVRKKRKGAFWEDRYHATAIEGGEHFLHCLMYIDLNIVRAGVVNHPSEWRFSGYNEIQFPRRKCVLISYDKLAKLAGCSTYNSFQVLYKNSIAQALEGRNIAYDSLWTKNVAVGSKQFVENIKKQLKAKAVGRQIYTFGASDNIYELRESTSPYNADFNAQNANMGSENTYDLDLFPVISDC